MALEVVEYKMYRTEFQGNSHPDWLVQCAEFPLNNTYVGCVPPESERSWYVPDGLVYLTQESFTSRLLQIHQNDPFQKHTEGALDQDGNPLPDQWVAMTEAEVREVAVDRWQELVNYDWQPKFMEAQDPVLGEEPAPEEPAS